MKLNDEIKLPPRLSTALRIGFFGVLGLILSIILRVAFTEPPKPQPRKAIPTMTAEEMSDWWDHLDRTPTPTD